ncbi:hypothetical protein QR680_007695 [Steinernema hermaphroditum]|uniref:C2H2-type domain-containing protein n=1 Tax=Steinernema hermaphroditum TaxID=289476 RepID=A0AA39M6T5_9BILA|nr:hypothetical protein QR680_007695 [Steinernema hermaphroditum]
MRMYAVTFHCESQFDCNLLVQFFPVHASDILGDTARIRLVHKEHNKVRIYVDCEEKVNRLYGFNGSYFDGDPDVHGNTKLIMIRMDQTSATTGTFICHEFECGDLLKDQEDYLYHVSFTHTAAMLVANVSGYFILKEQVRGQQTWF